jgi:hypothetical protein
MSVFGILSNIPGLNTIHFKEANGNNYIDPKSGLIVVPNKGNATAGDYQDPLADGKSDIYLSPWALKSVGNLFYTLSHELVHVFNHFDYLDYKFGP